MPESWTLDPDAPSLWAATGAVPSWDGLLTFCEAVAHAAAFHLGGSARTVPCEPFASLPHTYGPGYAALVALCDKTSKRITSVSAVRWYAHRSRLLDRAFPPLRLIADDAAALFAFLAARECLYLSAGTVSSYIGAITGFAGRTMGVRSTPDVLAHKLVAVRLAAWLPKTVDTRPPVPRRAFLDACSDKSAPLACRLALAFCFDTVSRSSDYLTESRADSCKPVPMPLGHVTVGLCPKGFPVVDLRTTVKGDRKGVVTTIRASCSPGSPECHPCGLNAAKNIRAWVVWRRKHGASPDEPLWRLADGRGATAEDVLDLLRKHTDLAVSLHTTRISSASEAVARGGFTLGQLATLGGWSSADACRRYVRTIVVGAS